LEEADVIEILNAARDAGDMLRVQMEYVHGLDAQLERVTQRYSEMPGAGGGDKMAELTARKVDTLREALVAATTLIKRQEQARSLIALLQGEYMEVLTRRYLMGCRWTEIAVRMGYSLRQVYRLHDQAISEIAARCH